MGRRLDWTTSPPTLDEAVVEYTNPDELLKALAQIASEQSATLTREGKEIYIDVRTNNGSLHLSSDRKLRGTLANRTRVVYRIVRAIETELSSHVTSEILRSQVRRICENEGISEGEFSRILHGWSGSHVLNIGR